MSSVRQPQSNASERFGKSYGVLGPAPRPSECRSRCILHQDGESCIDMTPMIILALEVMSQLLQAQSAAAAQPQPAEDPSAAAL